MKPIGRCAAIPRGSRSSARRSKTTSRARSSGRCEREKSRIVGCIPGHYTWTFDDPLFRILVFRSICWAAKIENVDRLAELSTIGARVVPDNAPPR